MNLYNEYKCKEEWKIVQSSINGLLENNDIKLTTNPDYVIGYIVKSLENVRQGGHTLYDILEELDLAKIHYQLARYRKDTVRICVTVVGARIEIEVFNTGSIETSIFKGDESIESGIEVVNKIINDNRD